MPVTFLALGNGAPDISSSIAAIASSNFEMALGALLGAHEQAYSLFTLPASGPPYGPQHGHGQAQNSMPQYV